ncbi:spore germination protein [Cohnella panacarvi]|uniref:spore germination protein n=1 Tax=Cohnella panacarvi TaxID=400776 RepID=UPI00047CEC31|nr:spore germination protein [Cohnella panacarvi]
MRAFAPRPDAKPVDPKATMNAEYVRDLLASPTDLVLKELAIGAEGERVVVCCIDGLVDRTLVDERLLRPLMSKAPLDEAVIASPGFLVWLQDSVLPLQGASLANDLNEAVDALLAGDTVLFSDASRQALVVSSQGWKTRSIEEPQTEAIIRGPRDGFTEEIRTNTSLIRKRIRDHNLRMVSKVIGRRARKELVVAYVEGIVNPELLKEVMRRIDTLDMDDFEGSGFVEQWLADHPLSPFPTITSTERPDKVTGALLQGRIALIVEGTPFQLIVPATFTTFFQSPEDYYQNWYITTTLRVLRYLAAFIATFLPALYIALLEYHHGMLPSKLAFSLAGSREGVPFPAVVEALLMEVTLELLREAGIRLPKPIGQTIGIVGGLVIGEAAVAAGIVSPIMVIIVSITAITSFALPAYSFAISLRLLRFFIMLCAAVFGLYGIILAYIAINVHVVNLQSFGVPYTTPIAPTFLQDWKDFLFRAPVMQMSKRPEMMQTVENKRMKERE